MSAHKKIVIKVGSSTLTQGGAKLCQKYMLTLAEELASLHEKGVQVILVSSGAIAAGRELLNHPTLDRSLPSKQMFAAIGQVHLMQVWQNLFALFKIHVGQILLTMDDLSNRERYLNARDTLGCLLQHKILPIINENDSVATKEIRVGDNDNLAALVANLVGADQLILLTDQEGLFTADPRHDKNATLIPVVKKIDESHFALAKGSSTKLGTGGMTTKLEAAQRASRCGVPTVIASSADPHVLHDIIAGKPIGTLFLTDRSPQESRKRWLLSEKKEGQIVVDEGAALRLMNHGASLLPSGILKALGPFERGAVVQVLDPQEQVIAVGITHYGKEEIDRLIGRKSSEIEALLGYTYGDEIIHRSNMVNS